MAACEYGQIAGGECGPSVDNPANSNSVVIAKCTKDIQGHLRAYDVRDASLDSEPKLLLARAGICTQCRRKLEESSPIESTAQEFSPIEDHCGPELEEDISENIAKIEDCSPCQPDSQLDDSIRHLTIEEENLSQPDSTLGDSVHQLTTEETSLYQPNSQSESSETFSGSDTPTTSLTTKRVLLNDFLRSCDSDTVGPYKRRWEEATVRTRANHVSKAKSVIVAGLNVIAPGDAGYLWEAVRNSGSVEKELGIGEPDERKYLVALAESYENASSWETRRQILSIMADLTTFKHIQSYIPGLTEYRFKMARQHSLQYGRGVEVPRAKSPRMRVERKQLDHFLTYITSPHVIQDIPFGQRYLRLSSGKILETPNVIRTMIPSRLVKQYQTYCVETDFTPFSPATMLRVLSACAATTRKSLQGLDYVAADGAKGFKDLCSMVEQLLYADDTQLYLSFKPTHAEQPDSIAKIEACVSEIDSWMVSNKLKLNRGKTELLILSPRHRPPPSIEYVDVSGEQIEPSPSARNIGVIFDEHMSLEKHVTSTCKACFFHFLRAE
ncbi:hypothetical protein ACROYT_G026116 [Oculina patagonica]